MPQLAQVIYTLELLESKVYDLADFENRLVTAQACAQLLQELQSLRDRFSLRAYMELYERAVFVESIIRDSGGTSFDQNNR